MGLIKGAASYTRYLALGWCDPRLVFEQGVRVQRFKGIDDTVEEYDSGWVRPDDWLDSDLAYANCVQEPYVLLGFRADRRRVKGPVLKKELRKALDKWREEHPEEPLNKTRRGEIKERVRLGLLRRLPPEPSLVELIWNTSTNEVWVGSQAEKALATLETKFRASFGLTLLPRLPLLLGMDLLADQARGEALCEAYQVQPFLLPDAPPVNTLEQPSTWLTQDFLTWLWATSHIKGGLDLGELGRVDISLGTELRLGPRDGQPGSTMAIKSGPEQTLEDEDLAEAFEAMEAGKRPVLLSLELSTGDGFMIKVTLKAGVHGPAGLILPPTGAGKGSEWWGAALERVSLIKKAQGILDGLFLACLLAMTDSGQTRLELFHRLDQWIRESRAGDGGCKPSAATRAAAQRLVDTVQAGTSMTITGGDGKGVHVSRPAQGGPAQVTKVEGQSA